MGAKKAMPGKLYAFNASSFSLDAKVEEFLKARSAISLDFGSYAYVNSDLMPVLMSELLERPTAAGSPDAAAVVGQLKAELTKFAAERQRLMEESAKLASQLKASGAENASLKEQAAASAKVAEALRAENARLKVASAPSGPVQSPPPAAADPLLKQSYERLVREFQQLRSQSIEAITSLKVLEDENTNLQEEIEMLRAQAKNASAPKP
jgi:septal ring factor EnvC (AmiA/AmiB activator)